MQAQQANPASAQMDKTSQEGKELNLCQGHVRPNILQQTQFHLSFRKQHRNKHLLPIENELKTEEFTTNEAPSSPNRESPIIEEETFTKTTPTQIIVVLLNKMEPTLDTFLNACLYGHKDVVRQLIVKHSDMIDIAKVDSVTGFTAFHLACTGGHLSVVQQLLTKFGSNRCTELVNKDGLTGLELASQSGRRDVVQAILKTCKKIYMR